MTNKRSYRQGIELKKKYGQHFLKDRFFVDQMINAVHLDDTISVMEIGCGEGILTGAILQKPCKQLKVFEIDEQWASYVAKLYGKNSRLNIVLDNVLDAHWDMLHDQAPWVMLANLPYQITFPILHRIQQHRAMFREGVIMIQEEVAQKIVKTTGRDYGYSSLFFQHYFELKLLDKISPGAFFPPPQVYSRLLYFKPRQILPIIAREEEFWKFIKLCFHQPRRTLRNNLAQSHFDLTRLDQLILLKRAQQLSMQDLLAIWITLN
ncbi:ribosomal RNA small subunit methyltransferase A [candidate division TM6 bacterium RIFCSPHIGHO2_12_FULL_38_8]|nr:MAG: ribosomal RNA small subunit methyltransferase A [candidate division TM6 bacterium RIFCSPHIGHO2_12_FULL_38_8]